MFPQRGGWAFWMLSASSLPCPVNVLPSEARLLSLRAPKAARPFICPCLCLFSCAWGWGSNRTIHLAGLGPIRSWDPGDLESVVPLLTAINSRQEPHSDADAKDLLMLVSALDPTCPQMGPDPECDNQAPIHIVLYPELNFPFCMSSLYEAGTQFHLCPAWPVFRNFLFKARAWTFFTMKPNVRKCENVSFKLCLHI